MAGGHKDLRRPRKDPLLSTFTYTYDSLGRRTRVADPDLGAWTFVYDAAGQMTRRTDAIGQVTALEYDSLGRLTKKTARFGRADSEDTENTYDEARGSHANLGRLTTQSNPAATMEHDYDDGGRVVAQRTTVGTGAWRGSGEGASTNCEPIGCRGCGT